MKKIFLSFLILFFMGVSFNALAESEKLPEFKISPESPFYFLKIWQEKIRTFLTFGEENKAKQFLHLSEVRLAEYKKMVEIGNVDASQKTLEKYNQQLSRAIDIIGKSRSAKDLIASVGNRIIRDQGIFTEILQNSKEPLKKVVETAIEDSKKASINVLKMELPELKNIGGDKDEHGCFLGAGYSWCEVKKKCIRIWEEKCEGESIDFEKTGNLTKSDEDWILVYDGAGKPALMAKLVFSKESLCNISGRRAVLCSDAKLNVGDRVTITGREETENTVSVTELIKVENNDKTIKENNMNEKVIQEEGLKIEVLKDGSGDEAKNGNTVSVHYTGWLENGNKFDSSLDRKEPFSFLLGSGQVIGGWDKGVLGMRVGEKRKLTIQPELGYGKAGAGGGVIPPNAVLIFEVEMLGIK